jgi:hypothetical protein
MPAYPIGPITQLVNGLKRAPELKGYTVLASAKLMPRNGSPPRIVIYPTAGTIRNPRDKSTANRDVDRELVAHLWGHDFDECCYLETLLVQALVNQGAGGDPVSSGAATPGLYWTATDDVWELSEDSNRQGEEIYVRLTAVTALDKVKKSIGSVGGISYAVLTGTLAVTMASGDLMAFVASTLGFPPTGLLTIDSEQMQYSGTTGTSFTGLIRGVNGTTPSSHTSGATVNVS